MTRNAPFAPVFPKPGGNSHAGSGQQRAGQRVDRLLDLVGDPAEALVAATPRVVQVVGRAAARRPAGASCGRRRPGPRPGRTPPPGSASAGGSAAASTAASSRPNSPSTKVRAAASGRSATTYSCWSAVAVRTRSAASMWSERSLRAANPSDVAAAGVHLPGRRRVHLLARVPAAGAGAVAVHQLLGPGRVLRAPGQPLPDRQGEQPLGHRRAADVAHADVQDGERRHSDPRPSTMSGTTSRSFSSGIAPARSTRGTSPVRSTIVLGTGSGQGPASR